MGYGIREEQKEVPRSNLLTRRVMAAKLEFLLSQLQHEYSGLIILANKTSYCEYLADVSGVETDAEGCRWFSNVPLVYIAECDDDTLFKIGRIFSRLNHMVLM